MNGRPTWTDCNEAGDYVVPTVLSPRDLVSRPDHIDETVPHTQYTASNCTGVSPQKSHHYTVSGITSFTPHARTQRLIMLEMSL